LGVGFGFAWSPPPDQCVQMSVFCTVSPTGWCFTSGMGFPSADSGSNVGRRTLTVRYRLVWSREVFVGFGYSVLLGFLFPEPTSFRYLLLSASSGTKGRFSGFLSTRSNFRIWPIFFSHPVLECVFDAGTI